MEGPGRVKRARGGVHKYATLEERLAAKARKAEEKSAGEGHEPQPTEKAAGGGEANAPDAVAGQARREQEQAAQEEWNQWDRSAECAWACGQQGWQDEGRREPWGSNGGEWEQRWSEQHAWAEERRTQEVATWCDSEAGQTAKVAWLQVQEEEEQSRAWWCFHDALAGAVDAQHASLHQALHFTHGGLLPQAETQAHVSQFIKKLVALWEATSGPESADFRERVRALFPTSLSVVNTTLSPHVFVTETRFLKDLDDAHRILRGLPLANRAIAEDEVLYGTVQCYYPPRKEGACYSTGVIHYHPCLVNGSSSSRDEFQGSMRTVTFKCLRKEHQDALPKGSRVGFNLVDVQGWSWDFSTNAHVMRPGKKAINVSVLLE